MITVFSCQESSHLPAHVMIDDYVPTRFLSYDEKYGLGGARYVRLIDSQRSFIEFRLARNSMTLRGFTTLTIRDVAANPLMGTAKIVKGLPTLTLPENAGFDAPPTDYERSSWPQTADLHVRSQSYLCKEYFEMQFGNAAIFDHVLEHGRVKFLLMGNHLVGLQIVDITPLEVSCLKYHMGMEL